MTNDLNRAQSVFLNALAIESDDVRNAYLDAECREDESLRLEVQGLLEHAPRLGEFLENNDAAIDVDSIIDSPEAESVADQIGPYLLREQIGEGGMGVVYVAEQTEPVQRKVALKIIKPGMDTKEVIARFEAERQALAFMEHPNIARVLDAGATESGRSYFVMELVRGIPITEYCDQVKATPSQRLQLFRTVCDAVQHAHQKGIIHRDIKPSNVLVTQIGGNPVVKVIDFGLAKAISGQRLTEKTLYTGFMKLMGTPAYMSPEQAGLSGLDVDTRSDIYSLGVLLYELLTGTTPLDKTEIQKQAYDELCRQIREVDAPKPSTRFSTLNDTERSAVAHLRKIPPHGLRQMLDGDLDRVVLMAIEKDRERRYGSPQDLADDIERFLQDKPVLAVPPSPWYVASKYIRRYQVPIITAAIILASLVATTCVSMWQAVRVHRANEIATSERNLAREARDDAIASKEKAENAQQDAMLSEDQANRMAEKRRRELYAANMQLADQIWNRPSGTMAEIQELLVNWIPVDPESEDLREFAWRYQWSRLHGRAVQTLHDTHDVVFSNSGNLVIANATGIHQWNKSNNTFEQRWTGEGNTLDHAKLSPCGRWASVSAPDDTKMDLIEIATGQVMHEAVRGKVTFSVDGELALLRPADAGWAPSGEILHLRSGKTLPLPEQVVSHATSIGLTGDVSDERILDTVGPAAETFVVRERDHVSLFTVGQSKPHAFHPISYVSSSSICRRGKLFAYGHDYGGVHVCVIRNPDVFVELPAPRIGVTQLAFSRDSNRIAIGDTYGIVNVWDVADLYRHSLETEPSVGEVGPPSLVHSVKAHSRGISKIVFSDDGMTLATRSHGKETKVWKLEDESRFAKITERAEDVHGTRTGVQFETVEGEVRVKSVISDHHKVVHGEIHPGDRVVGVTRQNEYQAIEPEMDHVDVDYMMSGPRNSLVELHLQSGAQSEARVVQLQRLFRRGPITADVTFIRDGASLAISDSALGAVTFSPSGSVTSRLPYRGSSVVLSPTGKTLALDDGRHLVLWDLQDDQLRARWESCAPTSQLRADFGSICFSPDEKFIAMGTGFRFNADPKRSDLKVWEIASRAEIGGGPVFESDVGITGVTFYPDGTKLLAVTRDGMLRIFDTSTWLPVRTLKFDMGVRSLALTQDGDTLALGGNSGVMLYDLPSGKIQHVLRNLRPLDLAFSPDGTTLVATETKAILVDVATGMQLGTLDGHSKFVGAGAFSPDNESLATIDIDGNLQLWQAPALDQIDRDPVATRALFDRGVSLNRFERYSEAEMTFRRVVQRQQETLSPDAESIERTREHLLTSLRGQQKLPIISKQPATRRVALGDTAKLGVETSNDAPWRFTYQWFFAGKPIEDATQSTLTIHGISDRDIGRYHVEIGMADDEFVAVPSEGAFLVGADGIAKGGLRKDVFLNIPTTPNRSLADLTDSPRFPHDPDLSGSIGSFELPAVFDDGYGVRISGYLKPPTSGDFVFYLVSNDSSQLFVSSDESPENKQMVASVTGQEVERRGWQTVDSASVSAPVTLKAGKRYWVEALFREKRGGDHLSVTWQIPGQPPPKNGDPPISGQFLECRLE